MRVHFGSALHLGGLVLASTGDFGPAFVAALDVETGVEVWRERTFARAQMLDAGGRLVILDEDGDLAVASVTLNGLQVHARAAVLTSNAWTPPTLVGSTLHVRDRHQILALDLDDPAPRRPSADEPVARADGRYPIVIRNRPETTASISTLTVRPAPSRSAPPARGWRTRRRPSPGCGRSAPRGSPHASGDR